MTTPGWYPDPFDAAALQYYDGQQWTGQRRPSPRADQPQGYTLVARCYPPAAQPWAATPAEYGLAGFPVQDDEQPTGWLPVVPRRHRGRTPLIIGLVVVLVAALLGAGWFFLPRKDAPPFTFGGKEIAKPEQVLTQAESAVMAVVASRHGAKNADTRCYFAQPAEPPKGTKKSDIDGALRCGPVLFVDGDTAKPYLSIPVSSAGAKDGKVTLTVAGTPSPKDPDTLPSTISLRRPDSRTPPSAAGGLSAPEPQAAGHDLLIAADLGKTVLGDAPPNAVIASRIRGVKLTKLGKIDRYGTGDDARSAPKGQQLIAFQTGDAPGQAGSGVSPGNLSVSVDKAPGRPLPDPDAGQSVVVAVPTSATSVELVLLDEGLDQRLSLLDGKPLATNVAVLTRKHLTGSLSVNLKVRLDLTNGNASATATETITASRARLEWWSGTTHASSGAKAFLVVDLRLTTIDSAELFGVDTTWLTLAPTGGTPIKARNLASGADKIFNVFEVPASFTTGTITISGSSASGGITATVANPQTFAVSIPAN
ncbi:MAG: DUF2510 domain-containing protein [Actinomycetota bacterium]